MIDSVVIEANGEKTIEGEGTIFACLEADGEFKAKRGSVGKFEEMKPGRGIGTPLSQGGKLFSLVLVKNQTGAPVTIKFYIGTEAFQNDPPVVNGAVVAQIVSGGETAVVPTEGFHLFAADDTVEVLLASSVYYRQLLLYPAKAASGGVLTPNTLGEIYAGRSGTRLPDRREVTDTNYPILYDCPAGQKMLISEIRVRGKIGDGVFYSFT